MSTQKNKKYVALIGIVLLILGLIGLFTYGSIDKYKGLIKVKSVLSDTSLLSASISNSVNNTNTSMGSDEIDYDITYFLDSVDGVETRDVIIKGTLTDDENRYARFKRITGNNITSNLLDNGKEIEIEIKDARLGVDNNIKLKLVITNAPNEFKVRPNITIREKTSEEETRINIEEVEVNTRTISGQVTDEDNMPISSIELSLNKDGEEIRRTYTDEEGNYNFSDIDNGLYEIKVEEEIYELDGNNKIDGEGILNIKVKEVSPYELETHKYITNLDLVVNGENHSYTYDDLDTVIEVVKNAKTISGEISYKITIKNTGEKTGKLSLLKDKLDEGLSFDENKNSGWKLEDGNLYYEPIENVSISGGETREVFLKLDIKNTNEIKTYINEINVYGDTYEKVVYILNGQKYKEENVIFGEKITEPEISDEGFSGWYTDRNYTNKYNFNKEVTKDLILYGKIEKQENKYTVLFMDDDTLFERQEVNENEKATIPSTNPTKSHNIFKNWLLDDEVYDFNTPVTRDIILYSSYEEVEKPAVSHTPTEWTNQNVLVTITNRGTEGKDYTGYSYKYRVNDGSFKNYTGPFEIEENCDIYAIAVKQNVDSEETKHEITNIDKIKPRIEELDSVSSTKTTATIEISSYDNESGLDLISIYNGDTLLDTILIENKDTSMKTVQYTVTDLEPGTTYEIGVTSKDVAGNISDKSLIEVTTEEEERIVAQITHVNNTELSEYIPLSTLRKGIEYNQDGINCITSQCTIQMLESVTESNEVLEGQDITLDLNGKTVTGLINYTINNNGLFTLIDTASEPGVLSNNISTSIINTGTLTMGINDERLQVSITHPSVYGVENGVYTEGTFNFYDGVIVGTRAILGIVDNTPDLYGADVRVKIIDDEEMQEATLKRLTDPEARIGRVYYTKLADAFAAAKNGTYEDIYVDDESFMEEDPDHEYTFVKDETTGYLVSNNNIEGTTATKEMVIDLSGYSEDQNLKIDTLIESNNVDSWGYIRETARINVLNYADNIWYTGDSFNYAGEESKTLILKKGIKSKIEIEFITYNEQDEGLDTDSKFTIKDIYIEPNRYEYITTPTEDTSSKLYGFDYDENSKSYKSNNNYTVGTTAFSYYEVDLTNKEGNYLLTLNALLDTYEYYNRGYIVVKEDNSISKSAYEISNYLGLMQSGNSGQRVLIGPYNYSQELTGGKKYYVQFYYFKNDYSSYSRETIEASGCMDQFTIKSLNVVKTSTETTIDLSTKLNTISNGFTMTYYDGTGLYNYNVSYSNPADSFVEIDLTNSSKDELITIKDQLSNSSINHYFYLTNNGNNLDFNSINNDRSVPLFLAGGGYVYGDYYINGNNAYNNQLDYSFVLKKGYKYYLHVASIYNNPSSPTSTASSQVLYSIKRKVIDSTLYDIGEYKINNVDPISTSDSLIQDNTDDKNYRFVGASANNYIYFNDELWRIVGIFETENQNGNKAKRLKIMKNDIISYYSYDTSSNSINNGYGINEWSEADAMKLLNPGYEQEEVNNSLFWNRTSGNCYSSSNNYNYSCDFSSSGIKDNYKNYIDTVKWHTSAINASSLTVPSYTLKDLYEDERGNDTAKAHVDASLHFDDSTIDTVTRNTSWYGKVGLPYLSDIYYTSTGTNDEMTEACMSSLNSILTCINNNSWFHTRYNPLSSSNYYVINPSYLPDNSLNNLSYGLCYYSYRPAYQNIGAFSGAMVPTVYLSTKTKIDSGTGTSGDPFMISLGSTDNTSPTYGLVDDGTDSGETVIVGSNTDDYTNISNIDIDTFTFDEESGYYVNNNAGKPGSVAIKTLELDLTNSTKDRILSYEFIISSNNNSFGHLFIMKNNPPTVYLNNGTYNYDYNDYVSTYLNTSGTYSNSYDLILEKGYKYYISLYYFKFDAASPSELVTDTFKVKLGSSVDTSSEKSSTYRAYKGQSIIYNDEVDTIEVLKDITLEDTIDIEETKDVILDLNGFSIVSPTESTIFNNSGEMKVIDNSLDKNGVIYKSITNNEKGTFILDSGSIDTNLPIINKGNLVINGLVNSTLPSSGIETSAISNEGGISGTGSLISTANCGIDNRGAFVTGISINSNDYTGICNSVDSLVSNVTFTGTKAITSNAKLNVTYSNASNSIIELNSDTTMDDVSFNSLKLNGGNIEIDNSRGTVNNETTGSVVISNSNISVNNATKTDSGGHHKNTNLTISNSNIDSLTSYSNMSISGGTACNIDNYNGLIIKGNFESNEQCKYVFYNNGTITLGEKDGLADSEYPKLIGTERTLIGRGTINFYDGSITGKKNLLLGNSINEIEDNYSLISTVNGDTEVINLSSNDYVASINGNQYKSIEEAVSHVTSSNDEILLLKDIIVGNEIDINSEYTININLNGHNLKSYLTTSIFDVDSTLNVYDNNGTSEINLSFGNLVSNRGTTTIRNINIVSELSIIDNNNVLNINNCNITLINSDTNSTKGALVNNGTLNTNGNTISYSSINNNYKSIYNNNENAVLNIQNENVTVTSGDIIYIIGDGTTTVTSSTGSNIDLYSGSNGTFNNSEFTNILGNHGAGTLVISGGTYTVKDNKYLESTNITLNDTNITGRIEASTITINNSTVTSTGTVLKGPNININSGNISSSSGSLIEAYGDTVINIGNRSDETVSTTTPELTAAHWIVITYNNPQIELNFYDGKITNLKNCLIDSREDTFTNIMDGYNIKYVDNGNNTETRTLLKEDRIINTRTNEKYVFLKDAINEANNNDTLKLIKNIDSTRAEGTIVVPSGKTITLDLDKYIINKNSDGVLLNNKGTLKIEGDNTYNSKVINNTDTYLIDNESTLSIDKITMSTNVHPSNIINNSGTITIDNLHVDLFINSTDYTNIINNTGSLTINDIEILSKSEQEKFGKIINTGTMVVNGGDFNYGKVESSGTLNIHGGYGNNINISGSTRIDDNVSLPLLTVKSTSQLLIIDNMRGMLELNGSSVTGINSITDAIIEANDNSSLTITNGTINKINMNDASEVSIFGGTTKEIYSYTTGQIKVFGGTIHNDTMSSLNLSGAAIVCNNSCDIVLGTNDSTYHRDNPTIEGVQYGIYGNSRIKFYDGSIIASGNQYVSYEAAINGSITDCSDGYEIITDRSNNKETLYLSGDPAVKNLTTNHDYVSLATAIGEANNNDELKLLRDITILESASAINNSKNITLNLDSYSITTSNQLLINNTGTLNITGSTDSTITSNNQTSGTIINNSGTLNISSIKMTTNNDNMIINTGIMKINSGTYNSYHNKLIDNSGSLTIDNGTFNKLKYAYTVTATADLYFINNNNGGTITINDGSFKIDSSTHTSSSNNFKETIIYNDGTLNIAGGRFENKEYYRPNNSLLYLVYSNKGVNITGGTFTGNANGLYLVGDSTISGITNNVRNNHSNGTLTILNSTFNNSMDLIVDKVNISNSDYKFLKATTATLYNCTGGTTYADNLDIDTGIYNKITSVNSGIIHGTTTINDTITNNGTLEIKDTSTITTSGNGINNAYNASLVIKDNVTITSGDTGVYSGTVTLGKQDGTVSTTYPSITGSSVGILSSTLNFYDGVVKGAQSITSSNINPETNYVVDTTVQDNVQTSILVRSGEVTRVVTMNNINYESIQDAINSIPENGTGDLILQVNYTLPDNIVVPTGKTANLYLNGFTFDQGTYTISGTFNIIDGSLNGVGGAIYRFLASITGSEINPRNIIIYQMEDGSELLPEVTYKLYKFIDGEYKIVKVNENELGNYEIKNNSTDIRTTSGEVIINQIGEGIYKLVGSDGKEIEFDIYENGVSNNIRVERYSGRGVVTSSAIAKLILQLQTGIIRSSYILIILLLIILSLGYIVLRKKKEASE